MAAGLAMPLMERVVQAITIDHPRVHTLLATYRAHPSILKLYNEHVYGGVLKAHCGGAAYELERFVMQQYRQPLQQAATQCREDMEEVGVPERETRHLRSYEEGPNG